jgi:NAD(P)-dependent dehydrogenase (short-subunit alcohol dehydrogenase family)
MSKVWLITGSANGLGRSIAEAALRAGENVVATARQPQQLQDLLGQYGDRVLAVKHDVTNADDAVLAVKSALDAFGRLDVLVNNAGYGRFGPFEQISDAQFKGIVDTCFYGVIYTTRAALPVMRKQRSGLIFQVSSVGGRITRPGNSPYHAAKWAVSGFSEALAQETAAFGVRVCSLEPGGIRTNWGKSASSQLPSVMPDYEESVGKALERLGDYWGKEDTDPERMARLIVRLSDERDLPLHLLLGSNAVTYFKRADAERQASTEKWLAFSKSVDFGAEGDPDQLSAPEDNPG